MEIRSVGSISQQLAANNIHTSKNLTKQSNQDISFGCLEIAIPQATSRIAPPLGLIKRILSRIIK